MGIALAHSQYRKQRRNLLRRGIQLDEMRHDRLHKEDIDTDPVKSRYAVLHAKVVIADRDKLYIGALNLSPRSALINTENGVLIDDPDSSSRLADYVEQQLHPENTWQLQLDEKGRVVWRSSAGTRLTQPSRNGWQSFSDWFLGLFPLTGQI